ncbi:MmpS family transport accessory protein [Mycobacterium sp. pV006]|uniref:MmpS family transport accessory protein n=1 Tax=Mycobacterium sp. pV006 TaxID=3238983 RepID=UPI00351ACD39
MSRQYTAYSPYSLTPTERLRSARGGSRLDDPEGYSDLDTDVYPRYDEPRYDDPRYDTAEDYDEYIDEARVDRRWMWIAGVAGAILFVAVIVASTILSGGDSGSVSATVVSEAPSPSAAAPAPSRAPAPPVAAPPTQSLPAETVTTVTPTPEAPAPSTAAPVLPPSQAAPPPASAAPGTVTYRVTGNRALLDLVTVIYTDQQGALQTEVNVALPWSKTVVLDPGVTLSSVTATSVGGQLNCSITDANGSVLAAQNSNSIITNCTR